MEYITPVSPVSAGMYPPVADVSSKKEAAAQFTTIFLNQIFRQMLDSESENSIFGGGSNAFYKDMMIQKIMHDLAEKNVFGFEDLILKGID